MGARLTATEAIAALQKTLLDVPNETSILQSHSLATKRASQILPTSSVSLQSRLQLSRELDAAQSLFQQWTCAFCTHSEASCTCAALLTSSAKTPSSPPAFTAFVRQEAREAQLLQAAATSYLVQLRRYVPFGHSFNANQQRRIEQLHTQLDALRNILHTLEQVLSTLQHIPLKSALPASASSARRSLPPSRKSRVGDRGKASDTDESDASSDSDTSCESSEASSVIDHFHSRLDQLYLSEPSHQTHTVPESLRVLCDHTRRLLANCYGNVRECHVFLKLNFVLCTTPLEKAAAERAAQGKLPTN